MTRDDVIRDTAKHIRRVGELLSSAAHNLQMRAVVHDASKWSEEEWPYFEAATPKLFGITYGSEEYKAALREIKPGVDHHKKNNSHHPEFYEQGIYGMTLFDLIEMLCDWKAAGERHADGSLSASISKNVERFRMSEELVGLLERTAVEMGLLTPKG